MGAEFSSCSNKANFLNQEINDKNFSLIKNEIKK